MSNLPTHRVMQYREFEPAWSLYIGTQQSCEAWLGAHHERFPGLFIETIDPPESTNPNAGDPYLRALGFE